MQLDKIPPCQFGFALRRFLNTTAAYCLKWPLVALLLAKTDIKATYCRVHQDGISALRSTITINKLVDSDRDAIALICL